MGSDFIGVAPISVRLRNVKANQRFFGLMPNPRDQPVAERCSNDPGGIVFHSSADRYLLDQKGYWTQTIVHGFVGQIMVNEPRFGVLWGVLWGVI